MDSSWDGEPGWLYLWSMVCRYSHGNPLVEHLFGGWVFGCTEMVSGSLWPLASDLKRFAFHPSQEENHCFVGIMGRIFSSKNMGTHYVSCVCCHENINWLAGCLASTAVPLKINRQRFTFISHRTHGNIVYLPTKLVAFVMGFIQ